MAFCQKLLLFLLHTVHIIQTFLFNDMIYLKENKSYLEYESDKYD